ncbi:hydantoinase/oxoprolinase family protein [Pseudonocardia xishanensis]|uniref:Hydantoinase/oxoprolinase family protein n=1 Tax=Pseudonocardia xishanensis TaxID=630995 RepID=A0ABP8RZY9_9PSEU
MIITEAERQGGQVGVDVGGTFTDAYFVAADGTRATATKHPTTRPDPTGGIVGGLRDLVDRHGVRPDEIGQVTVGSTLALNAVLEGRGARTALVTTRGFRDILDIARERRASLYDLQQVVPAPVVPRGLRFEVDERIGADGATVTALDLEACGDALLAALDASEVESVAICLINSFLRPEHEEALRELITRARPHLFVSASVDVHRQYREYERTLVTAMNAYVGPIMQHYLQRLGTAVASIVPGAAVRITDSVGGAMNIAAAGHRPVLTIMSGPASGAAGIAAVSEQMAHPRDGAGALPTTIVGMDMGGTSCDVTVVADGVPDLTAGVSVGEHRVAVQAVDIHSIGAGGGTIAWVDDGGLLRVGPRSTGSVPGPACYGLGGTEPTVTDAHLILGHLVPDMVLGDRIRLDLERAIEAFRPLAQQLGMTVEETARGALRVADASMSRAVETITVRRGIDPRGCALVAYGGAAGLHAAGIARSMGISQAVMPRFGGVLSANGAVWAPEHYEAAAAVLRPSDALTSGELTTLVKELEEKARDTAGEAAAAAMTHEVALDMRFVGQTSTLRVPVPDPDAPDALTRAHDDFTERYRTVFGYVLPSAASEIENARVRLTVVRDRIVPLPADPRGALVEPTRWSAVFDGAERVGCDLWVLDPEGRVPERIQGPAVVVGGGSTALVHPGQVGTFDPHRNMTISEVTP